MVLKLSRVIKCLLQELNQSLSRCVFVCHTVKFLRCTKVKCGPSLLLFVHGGLKHGLRINANIDMLYW